MVPRLRVTGTADPTRHDCPGAYRPGADWPGADWPGANWPGGSQAVADPRTGAAGGSDPGGRLHEHADHGASSAAIIGSGIILGRIRRDGGRRELEDIYPDAAPAGGPPGPPGA